MKKKLIVSGYIIYILGIIVGSIFAAANPPIWGPFIVSLVIIIFGATLIIYGYKPTPQTNTTTVKENRGAIQEMLEKIYFKVKELLELFKEDKIELNELKAQIDNLLTGDILNFIDKRQYLINVLGFEAFGEIFGDFANAERNLNRTWTTLADNSKEEALISLEKAFKYLEESYTAIKRITEKKQTGSLV